MVLIDFNDEDRYGKKYSLQDKFNTVFDSLDVTFWERKDVEKLAILKLAFDVAFKVLK